jgi:hypothetical protein
MHAASDPGRPVAQRARESTFPPRSRRPLEPPEEPELEGEISIAEQQRIREAMRALKR